MFVSKKLKFPVVDVMTFGNTCQLGCARFVVHWTWNCSLVGAVHWNSTPLATTAMLLMTGGGFVVTTTLNILVAPCWGTPLSRTMVVMTLVWPTSDMSGVQVMTPVSGLMVTLFAARLLVTE